MEGLSKLVVVVKIMTVKNIKSKIICIVICSPMLRIENLLVSHQFSFFILCASISSPILSDLGSSMDFTVSRLGNPKGELGLRSSPFAM